MIRRTLPLLAALLILAPVVVHAAWADTLSTSGTSVSTVSLTPQLTCHQAGTSAVIRWTPPAALPVTHQAGIVSPATALTLSGNSVTVTPSLLGGLLGGLFGTTATVRVTATLPAPSGGSAWTASSDWVVRYRLVGLAPTASCS